MPPRTVPDDEVLDALVSVFRAEGFAGSTLRTIAEATGLQRSSLYHRFPGGKEQMADEVTGAVVARFTDDVLAPLADDGPVGPQLHEVGRRLERFYEGGTRSCLLDALSLGDPGPAASHHLAAAAEGWIDAFAAAARRAGLPPATARSRAADAVARIEGGLVLARVTGDAGSFRRAVRALEHDLATR